MSLGVQQKPSGLSRGKLIAKPVALKFCDLCEQVLLLLSLQPVSITVGVLDSPLICKLFL